MPQRLLQIFVMVLYAAASATCVSGQQNNTLNAPGVVQDSSTSSADEAARRIATLIPTEISGEYAGGQLIPLKVRDRHAYLVRPNGPVNAHRRWIWICPFWLGINNGHGILEHRFYVERFLSAGFHVAGINVGTSCGSPAAAEVCHEFYKLLTTEHRLNARCRLVGQSNGGLIAYAWAFRNPECVDRIAGICPATDFRTWPGLYNVTQFPEKNLGYQLSLEELTQRVTDFNPVDNLTPLAQAGVQILHVHGDKDDIVPMQENSVVPAERYQKLGGKAQVIVLTGLGHGGTPLYESLPLVEFLTEE
jgi:pimeloyl-ACP methyl ester carboxylesterase